MESINHDERETFSTKSAMIGCATKLLCQHEALGISELKGGGLGTVGAALSSI